MRTVLSDTVRSALERRDPVVALESSNITGGTYPANLRLAHEMDDAIRERGAEPARVALLHGVVHVGLDDDQLERLAAEPEVEKVSTRDLAAAIVRQQTAGTTVSASLAAGVAAGIRVFAVAGIGGVHRGAESSFDISADLTQFDRSPIIVVCAGAKSLLDPRLTLEYLETLGVPVIGYRSDEFPGYLSVSSGEQIPMRSDNLAEIAQIAHRHWDDVHSGAVLVTSPLPAEEGVDPALLDRLITQALAAASSAGAHGAALTPFVLRAVAGATAGRSTAVNRSALLATVAVAADLAVQEATVSVDERPVSVLP
ncbi:pseudouridine-5'-phosphate glycosidase [Curtobacterium sp. ISL-83]|uniref:pseudouridine-5'-phosphate glycosidase n=1 Tax=Curtobacterium sp. ISL-83 TaxID=2819145 RepID=UPI001BED041A|nr:pseudouridine-5'-phosphate glycosidase [Curtobacterium sp. ISL-83]MBT2504136.1 pseudouridine-5'-phosphate glycosidase [Curtobacterium sp. ISL-83]